jgi:two-component system, chemotaxis family, response regulator Rcp1
MHSDAQTMDVLLVEDNPGDVRLTTEALKDAKVDNRLHVTRDGIEAMAFLHRKEPFTDAARPDLILLDLNLPRKNGLEVLAEVKSDPDLKMIPIVVISTSTSDEDVLASYQLHANSFVAKPVDFGSFIEVVKRIDDYWLSAVNLPPKQ